MKLIKFIPLFLFFVFFALDALSGVHSFPYFWVGAMLSLIVFGVIMPVPLKNGDRSGGKGETPSTYTAPYSSANFYTSTTNPSTGLPMVGGCDTAGNAYGCGN